MERQIQEFILVHLIFGARHTRPRGAGLLHSLLCRWEEKAPPHRPKEGTHSCPFWDGCLCLDRPELLPALSAQLAPQTVFRQYLYMSKVAVICMHENLP